MAAAEGQDLKALDAKNKAASKKLKKHKTIKRLKKKHEGDNEFYEIKAFAAADGSGEHPLLALLHQCGYKNCMLIHGPTGHGQAGSYRAAYQDQLMPSQDVFDVPSTDEAGFVLPRDHEATMKDQTNLATIQLLHDTSKAGQQAMLPITKIAWEKRGWKVVNKQARDGDKGGMLACTATKDKDLKKEGYFQLADETADYWQLYENGVAVENAYSYVPRDCFDVEVGAKYMVTASQTDFDSDATKSGTPYDAATWADLSHDVLGQEVTVDSIVEDSDWPGYNVMVTTATGASHQIPIRSLRIKDDGSTALFLGEIGMWILSAELALFPENGYADRGKNVQPLVSEFKGVLEGIAAIDDLGYMEVVDGEDDDQVYNLTQHIAAWCAEATTDWSYDNY